MVVLVGLLLCTIVAFILYKFKIDFFLKLITLPLLIIFLVSVIYTLIVLAGAPIKGFPKNKFDYVAHTVTEQGKTIVLWAWPKDLEDFRLYTFPYSRKVEKQLQKAAQKGKKSKVEGEFKTRQQGGKRFQELFLYESKPELDTNNPLKQPRS